MSDLAPTNEETLQCLRANAKRNKMKVTLLPGENFGLGCGTDCFVHPPEVSKEEVRLDRDKYFKAWFMEL